MPQKQALAGLMHDATEAYLIDLPKPIKAMMPQYQAIESHVARLIDREWGLNGECDSDAIHRADMTMMATERAQLLAYEPTPWPCLAGVEPVNMELPCLLPYQAERWFLERYEELTRVHPRLIDIEGRG